MFFLVTVFPVLSSASIEGHTDNIPIRRGAYSSNWELSVARSVSVIECLVNKCGLPASRFIAAGYG